MYLYICTVSAYISILYMMLLSMAYVKCAINLRSMKTSTRLQRVSYKLSKVKWNTWNAIIYIKTLTWRQAFRGAVEVSSSDKRVPGVRKQLQLLTPVFQECRPREALLMAQIIWFLSPMWDRPGLSGLLWAAGDCKSVNGSAPVRSLSLS